MIRGTAVRRFRRLNNDGDLLAGKWPDTPRLNNEDPRLETLRQLLDARHGSPPPPLTDRRAMIYSAVFLWIGTGVGVFVAGMVAPELAPVNPWLWRIGLSAIAIVCVVSQLTWMKRLSDERFYWAANFWCVIQALIPMALMIANKQSIAALYISLLAPAAFVAQFMRTREVLLQVSFLTAVAVVPIVIHGGEMAGWHVVSRVVAFLPIMWFVVVAVWTLRRERQHAISAAEQTSLIDPLTGLANLRAFSKRADELLGERHTGRHGNQTGLLLIDLDDFKRANSLYGHAGGDHLLSAVGSSLMRATSSNHLVCRIGGDEFAVLLEDANATDIADQAIRYRNAVHSAQRDADMPGISLDASIGVALAPRDGETLADLMTVADRSMYEIKASPEHGMPALPDRSRQSVPDLSARRRAASRWVRSGSSRSAEQGEPKRLRPENAMFAAMTWAIGVSIGLLSIAMPDADHAHVTAAVIGLMLVYAVSITAYFTAPPVESPRHIFNDVFTLSSIAFISYLTGGADSPLWPLVYLFIAYEAWFLGWGRFALRAIGPVIVILAPLLYEGAGAIDVATGAAMYSGILVSLGLTLLLSYNQVNLQRAQELARHQATIDARTGLANRREFENRVEEAFAKHRPGTKTMPAIVMLDLDNFKAVNTAHGHSAGDQLLAAIATELDACTRAEDCVARVGGDEFAVILPQTDAAGARLVAERYVAAVAAATSESDLAVCRAVTASAGFALYGVHGHDFDELINAADIVLMDAKSRRSDRSSGGFVVTPGQG